MALSSLLGSELVPIQTLRRIWIRNPNLHPLTCPSQIPTSLSQSVGVDPFGLGLEESASEEQGHHQFWW